MKKKAAYEGKSKPAGEKSGGTKAKSTVMPGKSRPVGEKKAPRKGFHWGT